MANQAGRPLHRCGCADCRQRPRGRCAQEHQAINQVLATLDEKSRRLLAGLLAQHHGRGGIELLAHVTGLSRNTVRRGLREIRHGGPAPQGRIRRPGGGRPRLEKKRPA
jgi:hypothetical protein